MCLSVAIILSKGSSLVESFYIGYGQQQNEEEKQTALRAEIERRQQ